MTVQDRIEALQTQLQRHEYDAAILYSGPNMFYFGDFFGEPLDRHALLVVPATGQPRFITPRKSLGQIRDASPINRYSVVEENDPAALAVQLEADLDGSETLVVDERLPFSIVNQLQTVREKWTLESAAPLLTDCRIRKEKGEIETLQRSATIADQVSEEIRAMGEYAIGMTETELAVKIRELLHQNGGTRLSFDVVVASGPNAARPYYRHGDHHIHEGKPVILDFGAFVDGYASDQTRTVVFAGEPPELFKTAHETVRTALETGIDAVEPGRTAGEIDRIVESELATAGFEDNIIHATGHGVGVEAHEAPPIADGNELDLEPGMVFSIEPGIYFEDEFGVRVEDLVVVTKDGCERLNHSPRTWRPL